MRLDLTETFAGVPARRVRDALRRSDSRWVTPLWLAGAANCPSDQTDNLVDALVSRGLVERDTDEDVVKLTEQEIAFSQASLTTVTRRTADRVLREFLDRVRALNADEDALYQVPSAGCGTPDRVACRDGTSAWVSPLAIDETPTPIS